MVAAAPLPDDFLSEVTRRNEPARNPFAEWPAAAKPGGAEDGAEK